MMAVNPTVVIKLAWWLLVVRIQMSNVTSPMMIPCVNSWPMEACLDDNKSRDFNEDKDGNCNDVWCLILAYAIACSWHLRSLKIIDKMIKDDVSNKLFFVLAKNRSVEHLSLDGFFKNARMDIFHILTSFIKHNPNLCSIKISVHGLNGISNFISELQQSKMIWFEKIGILWSIKMMRVQQILSMHWILCLGFAICLIWIWSTIVLEQGGAKPWVNNLPII